MSSRAYALPKNLIALYSVHSFGRGGVLEACFSSESVHPDHQNRIADAKKTMEMLCVFMCKRGEASALFIDTLLTVGFYVTNGFSY
jgi:hypothetical protein